MKDLKNVKPRKIKANRAKKKKEPIAWKKILHRVLLLSVRITSAVLIIFGSAVGAQLLLASDLFHIEQVRVEGGQRLSAEEVAARSDIQIGQSIFDIDLELVGNRLQKQPWIRQAQVQRIFPRQVVIRITERTPVAIVNMGHLYYLDAHGSLFKSLAAGDSLDYPVITGIQRNAYLEQPEETRVRLREAIHLLDQLKSRKLFSLEDVAEIRSSREKGMRLYTYDGAVPIDLGQGEYAAKLDRLEKVYKEIRPSLSILTGVDLRVDDRVIVKMKKEEARRG